MKPAFCERSNFRRAPQSLSMIVLLWMTSMQASAGPPFATDDPVSLPYRHGEGYLFTAGIHNGAGTALSAGPGVELNYSFLPDTFAHLVVSMAKNYPDIGPSASGLGDIELGFKWQMTHQGGGMPATGIFPLIEVPTGDQSRGLGGGHTQFFLPLWLQKRWGRWTSYGGAGYWVNPGSGNRNWWFSGVLVQRQITPYFYLGGEVYHNTPKTDGGNADTAFNFGGGYAIGGPYQLLFSMGRNFNHVDDNRLSWYFALYRTF